MRKAIAASVVIMGLAAAGGAWAWGATGHRLIGMEGARLLPSYVPAFLRTPEAIADIGEYANEPDRWRGAGDVHAERDAMHFIDLNDDGTTLAGMTLDKLPTKRWQYAAAISAKGGDPDRAGYLPYAEVDAYEQVVKDFAYWRVTSLMETRETDKDRKAWYHADRLRREAQTKFDIGLLAHYVGDATQPLHLSIHYNGWGRFPNPGDFTQDRIHGPLEGPYVTKNVTEGRSQPTPAMQATAAKGLDLDIRLYAFAIERFAQLPELRSPAFSAALEEFRKIRAWLEAFINNNPHHLYIVGDRLPALSDLVAEHHSTPALDRYFDRPSHLAA